MTGEEWKPVDMEEIKSIACGKIRPFCVDGVDMDLLGDEVEIAAEGIKNTIHQPYVPAGLKYALAGRAAGEYLNVLYINGALKAEAPVQTVKVGDTQISYSGAASVPSLIASLQSAGERELLRYRKLCF